MDIQKQTEYWVKGAHEDLVSAELLINNNRLLHGLFWCHLSIEKIIKAFIVKQTLQVPPKSHNLIWLLEKTEILLDENQESLVGELMVHQLEGRYPEYYPSTPSKAQATNIFNETKKLHQWRMNKL